MAQFMVGVLVLVVLVAITSTILVLFYPRYSPMMQLALEQQDKWIVMWSNFKEKDDDLQRQIDELKHELEELKQR